MIKEIQTLQSMLIDSKRVVFLGGAGVSTESGIPDFRSADGLFHKNYGARPEIILSKNFFKENPELFFKFYRENMLYPKAKPNKVHLKLAEMERQGKLKAVITQNIDNLHQIAGSKIVCELHGTIYKNRCVRCGKKYPLDYILESNSNIPRCDCGGIIKPNVVLYDEPLKADVLRAATRFVSMADMLIVGGTSLNVYPAAGLIDYFQGKYLVLINKAETSYDNIANLVIRDSIGEVFSQLNVN